MALQKNKITEFGIKAGYWKIGMLTIDRIRKEATFILYLYLNKDDLKELEREIVSCIEESKEIYNKYFSGIEYTDIYNAAYCYVKDNVEFFTDALDI